MDTPYRDISVFAAAESFEHSVELVQEQQIALASKLPTYDEACAKYHEYVKIPQSPKEKISFIISQHRDTLLETICSNFTGNGVISVQYFIQRALQLALKQTDLEPLLAGRLLKEISNNVIYYNSHLEDIDLSIPEGHSKALEILEGIIKKINDENKVLYEGITNNLLGIEVDDYRDGYIVKTALEAIYEAFPQWNPRLYQPQPTPFTPDQQKKIEYLVLSFGSRICLAVGQKDEAPYLFTPDTNEMSNLYGLINLLPPEKIDNINTLLRGVSDNTEKSEDVYYKERVQKIIIAIWIASITAFILSLFTTFYLRRNSMYSIITGVQTIIMSTVALYTKYYRTSRLRGLRDQYPLEDIDPEAINIYKLVRVLNEYCNHLNDWRRNPDNKKVAAKATIILAAIVSIIKEEKDKPEALVTVGTHQIHLGSGALEQTLSEWKINLGADKKPDYFIEETSSKPRLLLAEAVKEILPKPAVDELAYEEAAEAEIPQNDAQNQST